MKEWIEEGVDRGRRMKEEDEEDGCQDEDMGTACICSEYSQQSEKE